MSINRTNKDVPFIHHEQIEEWDIHSANTSLMRYYKLAPKRAISTIEGYKKAEREKAVGLIIRKDKDFGKALEESFTKIIQEFLDANGLDPDKDVVSFKKDSVFVRNRTIKTSTFGDSIEFIKKHTYTGCLLLPKYEFYIGKDIDVKGIDDSLLPLHQDGMLQFIRSVMEESRDWLEMNRFVKEYSIAYKRRVLPYDAYREFNPNSKFRVNAFGHELMMDAIDDELLEDTDITFNYLNVYLETLKAIAK